MCFQGCWKGWTVSLHPQHNPTLSSVYMHGNCTIEGLLGWKASWQFAFSWSENFTKEKNKLGPTGHFHIIRIRLPDLSSLNTGFGRWETKTTNSWEIRSEKNLRGHLLQAPLLKDQVKKRRSPGHSEILRAWEGTRREEQAKGPEIRLASNVKVFLSQEWWCTPAIASPRRLMQAWAMQRPCSKT
jgi:hypothetical protein